MVKAHCDQAREELFDHVGKRQLGVMKSGYEVSVHQVRELSEMCIRDGEVIIIIDYSNAFNACNRSTLIKLVANHLPELATFAYWLYSEEAELVLSNGQSILSSEGGQRCCGLTNLLLALPMEYVM